ncbi:hypothetical protein ACFR9U_14330 [Halorientalis brevis]|uniref:Uncharacterized protein n=1 Tax=Halorientalis brevis TaxID=1126241 RepID=A0ABD6CE07_9EURY|nr:hypothetical protein [Halorientalis brevis]
MPEDRGFIEVHDIGPDDIPTQGDELAPDQAVEIAANIHALLREDYGLTDVTGVATVVNPQAHSHLYESWVEPAYS